MNETIKRQLEHRSIRKWKTDKVSEDVVRLLYDVANRTASSTGMQQFSIIRVTDMKIRDKIAKISGQAYINEAPEFWVFIVDCYRNYKIMEEQGENINAYNDSYRFFQGYTDGVLAAQNVNNAIESLGMGAVYFGSVLADIKNLIDILNLPKLTFPIFGLGFGYPDQNPDLKPRMENKIKFFDNEYIIHDSYLDTIKNYDKIMNTYYDLRDTSHPLPCFSKQVIGRLNAGWNPNNAISKMAIEQGFDFDK